MTKAIIDTDPGTDDALAIMMALNSPDVEVLGLTTVGGNASLAHTTRNALRLVEYMGRADIPVSRGASRPLKGRFGYAYGFHGPGGLTVRLPRPRSEPITLRAADYLVARNHAGELTLVALGPLTNVARALTLEPRIAGWLKRLVVMGGAVEVPSNVTPHAEFNIHSDPHAADLVLSSGAPVTLVGLDVCDRVYVTRDDLDRFEGGSRSEQLARRILGNWFASRGEDARYSLCDPLAMAAALNIDLLTFRQARVAVDTTPGEHLGRTTASYGDGNVMVAEGVDPPRAREAITSLLAGPPFP